jgi:hypothetical protein
VVTSYRLGFSLYALSNIRSAAEEKAEEVIEFVEIVRDHFDCDEDAHKYDTFCRCCEAKELLEKLK